MVLAVSACGEYFQPVMDNMTGYRNNPVLWLPVRLPV